MRTVTYRLVDLIHATINIGFVGENEHTRIIFDCKKAFEEYPSAVPSLSVTPPSGESYPAVVVRDGDYVYWDIMDSDVAMKGSGEGQLTFVVDSIVKKSYIFLTRIDRSIVPTGDAPSAIADWLVRANTALGAIPQTIADALAEAKASGEFDGEDGVGIDRITLNADYTLTIYLTNGSSYTTESIRGAKGDPGDPGEPGDDGISPTITVTDITGGHRLTITDKAGTRTVDVMDGEPGDPGEPGDDGVSPTVTITNITGGHRVKITDKTGDHTFDVMDGAKGDPGDPTDLIDDTAGTGDTDKTFSADKLTSMNSSVLNALTQSSENTSIAISAHSKGSLFWYNGGLYVALSAIAVGDTITTTGNTPNAAEVTIDEALIKDVQINGSSILSNGVANVPNADSSTRGVVKTASATVIKAGESTNVPTTNLSDYVAFYGLAKAAGDTTTKAVSGANIGVYTEEGKSKISTMLNAPVTISGTTPVINAKACIRYICGECATLDITVPASGDIEVIFDSGSTATVLTVTPPTGVTAIKWASGFDPTALDANTRYDLIITDGEWGMAASWGA